jgi:hypothetical protein
MESWQLGALVGILICLNFGLFWRLEACHTALVHGLGLAKDDLVGVLNQKRPVSLPDDLIDNIKDEILDTIGNMRQPTALDHIGGVIANVFQMREQWKIQKEASQINNSLISPLESEQPHGATTYQEENPTNTEEDQLA